MIVSGPTQCFEVFNISCFLEFGLWVEVGYGVRFECEGG